MGILEEVNASYEKLSPVQKRIADFIFKYPDQVCFYSLKELSETLGVTEVTILRFTKKIGAQSFVEMKSRLREHLQTRLVHGDGLNRIADHVGGIRYGDHDKEEMFREFVTNEKNVIAKTFEQVSLKDILSAVAIIRQSRKIYVVGSELVTGLCAYTTRRLLTLGLETLDLSNLSRALYNNYLAHATPEDCAIISGKLCGELDPLCLAAGKLRRGLSKTDIGKSHIVQCRDLSRDRRHVLKEL